MRQRLARSRPAQQIDVGPSAKAEHNLLVARGQPPGATARPGPRRQSHRAASAFTPSRDRDVRRHRPCPQRLPPIVALEIPVHGFFDPGLERFLGSPAQLGFELGGINRVTLVVPRAIGNERNQLVMRACWPGASDPSTNRSAGPLRCSSAHCGRRYCRSRRVAPCARMTPSARAWSSTNSQSRTFEPSP